MTRMMIVSALLAIGYLLMFAGVAEGGRYALRPWDALLPESKGGPSNTPKGGGGAIGSSSSGGGGILGTAIGIGKKILGIFGGIFGA